MWVLGFCFFFFWLWQLWPCRTWTCQRAATAPAHPSIVCRRGWAFRRETSSKQVLVGEGKQWFRDPKVNSSVFAVNYPNSPEFRKIHPLLLLLVTPFLQLVMSQRSVTSAHAGCWLSCFIWILCVCVCVSLKTCISFSGKLKAFQLETVNTGPNVPSPHIQRGLRISEKQFEKSAEQSISAEQ